MTIHKHYLGYAQTAFFGGRTSAHIRKIPVPVVYTDFLSMYPTVNALMGFWRFSIAKEVEVVTGCDAEIKEILENVTLEKLFDPVTWTKLPAFVRIVPNEDVLPTRARYSRDSNDYQIALSYLYARSRDPKDGLWYALPDVVASVLLSRRVPEIVDAFRIAPKGKLASLRRVQFRGAVAIDPGSQDFFRTVIEQRKVHEKADPRLGKELKTLANSTAYGIYAQMDRQESQEKISVRCYGIDPESFKCRVFHPEAPGAYCFPPVASLITAGARLMLALLERCVTDLGGTYAMEDTDSMAIVSTRRSGLIECPGGQHRKRGKAAVKALSWREVDAISNHFAALNPYDRVIVPGSVLKIEADNFNQKSGKQRQLWCLAISAKRYALFVRNRKGEPAILRRGINSADDHYSEHGLGHLLNPTDPQSDDREWIAQVWLAMIRRSLGLPTKPLGFEKRVAVGRVTVSSPAVLKALEALNARKAYTNQIKPFNFILSCQARKLGHPVGVDAARFHLIAPYETDPRRWERLDWVDQYSGKSYRVSASAPSASRNLVRVTNYGDVLRDYEFHPETKCADQAGMPCKRQTVGLLARRHVAIDTMKFIGKESNHLEEVEEQSVTDASAVYTEYPDPQRDEWAMKTLPKLKAIPMRKLMELSGMSRAALKAIRAGRRPHARNRICLRRILQ